MVKMLGEIRKVDELEQKKVLIVIVMRDTAKEARTTS